MARIPTEKQEENHSGFSSLKGLNLPTILLILASGGANLIGTHNGTVALSSEQQEALTKIRQLHQGLDDFEGRQRQAIDGIQQSLRNQNTMMSSDTSLLKEVHDIAQKFERYKNLEQQRGAPP
jgi:hypothetical protein